MQYFLTSLPLEGRTPVLSSANGFCSELIGSLEGEVRGLFICSDPNRHEHTDMFAMTVREALENAGAQIASYNVLDSRTAQNASELVRNASLIILGGGHVPTQNAFFGIIGLGMLLKDFDGVIVGISAGTMNCAGTVYAQPELDGEALDPSYRRFLPGLGITRTAVIPHYQMTKDFILDGMRVFEDITYPDSMGRRFYALCDGSYIRGDPEGETLYGEAYMISDGKLEKICSDGEKITL